MPVDEFASERRKGNPYLSGTDGLHVTDIEFPTSLPRYSILSIRRLSAPFRRSQRPTTQPPLPRHQPLVLPTASRASTNVEEDSQPRPSPTSNQTQNTEKNVEQEKSELLDRRWFSWTIRRWMFILGPCLAIVVMAVVLVAVFVTRSSNDSGSNTTSNAAPPAPPTTGSNGTVPGPTTNLIGAMNGTSIASAYPGRGNDALWVFYQDAAGDLVYLPYGNEGVWRTPVILPTIAGVLNGTALTALNYQGDNVWKINLVYQDSTGNLRNFLYANSGARTFNDGALDSHNISLPTDPAVVKRLSWMSDGITYHHLYIPENDGLIHEWTFTHQANNWAETFVFPNSNGYSGSAVFYDQVNNITTMHCLNNKDQLQMYWRNYTTNVSIAQDTWTLGASLPTAQTALGFTPERNATLSLLQYNATELFAQEAGTGEIWSVGWTGLRGQQRYTTAAPTNATALPAANLDIQHMNVFQGQNGLTHAFVQQKGNDIAHLILQADGTFSFAESLPV